MAARKTAAAALIFFACSSEAEVEPCVLRGRYEVTREHAGQIVLFNIVNVAPKQVQCAGVNQTCAEGDPSDGCILHLGDGMLMRWSLIEGM